MSEEIRKPLSRTYIRELSPNLLIPRVCRARTDASVRAHVCVCALDAQRTGDRRC